MLDKRVGNQIKRPHMALASPCFVPPTYVRRAHAYLHEGESRT